MERGIREIRTILEWEKDVFASPILAVVLFYSQSCGPSVAQIADLEMLQEEYSGRAIFTRVDVDRMNSLASNYRVSIIPTMMFFRRGQKLHEMITKRGLDEIRQAIEAFNE